MRSLVLAVAVLGAVPWLTGPAAATDLKPPPAPRVDADVRAAAKGCDLPVERVLVTQFPTLRGLPEEADVHHEPDEDGRGEEFLMRTPSLWLRTIDVDGDRRPDTRERELYDPAHGEWLDCVIVDRWSGGRWRVFTTTRFEGGEAVTTTFRGGRVIKVTRESAIHS